MNNNWLRSIWLVCLLTVSVSIRAEEYYKEIKKVISVSPTATIDFDLAFADVSVETGNFSQMEIWVKMDLDVRSEAKANAIFNAVRIDESRDYVKVTIREQNTEMNCRNNENFDIQVIVKMPVTARIAGKIEFGNLMLNQLGGEMHLRLAYGNLEAGNMTASTNKVQVEFGNFSSGLFNGGTLRCSYGNAEVQTLNGDAEIKTEFGNIDIVRVTARVTNLRVNSSYGNADIELDRDAGFRFDATISFGDLDLPDDAKKTNVRSDYTGKSIQGTIGNGTGNLTVRCDFGNLNVAMR